MSCSIFMLLCCHFSLSNFLLKIGTWRAFCFVYLFGARTFCEKYYFERCSNEVVSRPSARRKFGASLRCIGIAQRWTFSATERHASKYHVSHIIFYRSTIQGVSQRFAPQNVHNFCLLNIVRQPKTSSMSNLFGVSLESLWSLTIGQLSLWRSSDGQEDQKWKEIQRILDCRNSQLVCHTMYGTRTHRGMTVDA